MRVCRAQMRMTRARAQHAAPFAQFIAVQGRFRVKRAPRAIAMKWPIARRDICGVAPI
jgi:hypothetical protein